MILCAFLCMLMTSCISFKREQQSMVTQEQTSYSERVHQVVAYNEVTNADGSVLRTPVIVTLTDSRVTTTDSNVITKAESRTQTKTPSIISKGLAIAGIPGGDVIANFLTGSSESLFGPDGVLGMGPLGDIAAATAAAEALRRGYNHTRDAPPRTPVPAPVRGRTTGVTGIREEES